MSVKSKSGMTLVELLVVLVILAGLAVSVAVSSSGMLDRSRVEKTRMQGEAMRAALTRVDGLNLACDMGRMPNPAQPGELALLVSRAFREDVQHAEGDEGPLDANTAGDGALKFAPLYREYTMLELKSSITNNPANYALLDAFLAKATVSNIWRMATVGGGWRGPYCTACAQDGANQQLPDPFGGLWNFAEDGALLSLVSYGSDRLSDADTAAETNDWRTADLKFPVCVTNDTASLSVEWDPSALSSTGTVLVCCLAPRLNIDLEEDGDGICKMTPAAFASAVGMSSGGGISLEGLSPGNWCVFIGVDAGENGIYAAPVRAVSLQTGPKTVRFNLMKCE